MQMTQEATETTATATATEGSDQDTAIATETGQTPPNTKDDCLADAALAALGVPAEPGGEVATAKPDKETDEKPEVVVGKGKEAKEAAPALDEFHARLAGQLHL